MTFSLLQAFFFDYGYYAVFGVLVICGMGLPLPEDITLLTAGVISQLGDKNVHIMLVVAYLGVLCGDWVMYLIGWKFGPHLRQSRWFSKLLTPERMIQTETLFHRYGSRVIFVARFLPGLRAPIYVMTGIGRSCGAALCAVLRLYRLLRRGKSRMDAEKNARIQICNHRALCRSRRRYRLLLLAPPPPPRLLSHDPRPPARRTQTGG